MNGPMASVRRVMVAMRRMYASRTANGATEMAATAFTLLFDPENYPGTVLGLDVGVLMVSAAAAISVAPFAVLLAYILRIATITRRTLAIGPFVLRESERDTQS